MNKLISSYPFFESRRCSEIFHWTLYGALFHDSHAIMILKLSETLNILMKQSEYELQYINETK